MSRKKRSKVFVSTPLPPPVIVPQPDDEDNEICGDGICAGRETCQTCPEDCGPCNSTNPAVSNETIVYDTIEDSYSRVPDSRTRRIGHFAGSVSGYSGVSDEIFVFSGYSGNNSSGNALLRSCEAFDINSQKWSDIADIPTPRAFGMSAVSGHKIYCIGGIETDIMLNILTVSRKIEVFDTKNKVWNSTLSPMPEDHGVAYGDAQTAGNYIYIVCGFISLSANSTPGTLNSKILRYSITDDEWITITPSNANLYARISPFGFYRNCLGDCEKEYYVYGGSIPKSSEEIRQELQRKQQRALAAFDSFSTNSEFVTTLDLFGQHTYINDRQKEIVSNITVPAFIYPSSGFRFAPGSEIFDNIWSITIESLDSLWRVAPQTRDDGKSIYIRELDAAFFIGGGNQNFSTTLDLIDSIDLDTNMYFRSESMDRGRSKFAAVAVGTDIYILGGMTSGHAAGYVQINLNQFPGFIETTGEQSNGFIITITNDAGTIVDQDIRVSVRGTIRIPEVDAVLKDFISERSVNKILESLPQISDEALAALTDEEIFRLISAAQNKFIDPNADEFQMNSSKKLVSQVLLFPILYSSTDFIVQNGIGGFVLKPRSEDPLADIKKLSEFIARLVNNTIPSTDERFLGDLTREELASLGDALSVVNLPPIKLESNKARVLYNIETSVTVIDNTIYGSSISDSDLSQIEAIRSQIASTLQEKREIARKNLNLPKTSNTVSLSVKSDLESGQSLNSLSKVPLSTNIKKQLPTIKTTYFNKTDWLPQTKHYFTDGTKTPLEVFNKLDILDHQTPFGSSQLYDVLSVASHDLSGEDLDEVKKIIYVASDNSENFSLTTRSQAIDDVNSIDGDGKVPVIYTVFNTSYPVTISAQLERTDRSDIEKITHATGGQSNSLVSSNFISQILNLSLANANGGLGYGIYKRVITFDESTAITSLSFDFSLPANTNGFVRIRYSSDGFNYSDWSQRYEGSQTIDLEIYAKILEIEVILSTGFTADIAEEYDTTATGIPKLRSITMETSEEREDFIYLSPEYTIANVQQIATAMDGHIPTNAIIEIGAATSNSHDWQDFKTTARPAVREFGKIFMLERSQNETSAVPAEYLTSDDGWLWKTTYGPWDPESKITLLSIVSGQETEIKTGFRAYPRQGEIFFDTKQALTKKYVLTLVNKSIIKVGMRLRNRLHSDAITVTGSGYMYSTNDDKPNDLVQLPPIASRVTISPANPTAADTMMVLYKFIDSNNDQESGSVIRWFKNSIELREIAGKTSWSNSNLLPKNKLQPGDTLTVNITPSDGTDFGVIAYSDPIIIIPRPPTVGKIKIFAQKNNQNVGKFDSASTFVLDYEYLTEDIGEPSLEENTKISWIVNGLAVKEGQHSFADGDTASILKLLPTESLAGSISHPINASISIDIIPRSASGIIGTTYSSGSFIVQNTVPSITDAITISPVKPIANISVLLLSDFSTTDIDISAQAQTDQTEIQWFQSANGVNFSEVTIYRNKKQVLASDLISKHQWYALITPFDGIENGTSVKTNTVVVS